MFLGEEKSFSSFKFSSRCCIRLIVLGALINIMNFLVSLSIKKPRDLWKIEHVVVDWRCPIEGLKSCGWRMLSSLGLIQSKYRTYLQRDGWITSLRLYFLKNTFCFLWVTRQELDNGHLEMSFSTILEVLGVLLCWL